MATTTKHFRVRQALMEAIRSGEFPPESRLPSEREIADRFGVSYLTARRAVAEMVDANLLERRARSGTYVRKRSPERLLACTVNLICTASDYSLVRDFLRIAARQVEERGWGAQVIRLHPGADREAIRALDNGELAIVLTEDLDRSSPLVDAMRRANGRAVVLSNRLEDLGIPSVTADDTQALRLAVTHLQERGHRHIGLICDQPSHPIARVQIAAWRACCARLAPRDEYDRHLVAVRTESYECFSTSAYNAVKDFLTSDRSKGVTALISLFDEITPPTLAACREAGCPVPEAMSLVSLVDSAVVAFAHPPVTCVDVDLERHVQLAMEMLTEARGEALDPESRLRLVEPRLIVRQSVAPLTEP